MPEVDATLGHVLLDAWIRQHGKANLARKAEVEYMSVDHVHKRRRRPSFDLAFKIDEATGGEVYIKSWFRPLAQTPNPRTA